MQQRTRIKICGLTRADDLQAVVDAGADAVGFVFYSKSPRYVSPQQAGELIAGLPPFVTAVGLFVNASVAEVQDVLAHAPLALLQFHGDETALQCHQLAAVARRPFIRAFRVKPDTSGADLLKCAAEYRSTSPYFQGLLLDTHVEAYGGSGKVFDWSLIPKEFAPQVVLSGGLNVHNITDAVRSVQPFAVDVSSGVELDKGIKDIAKVRGFIQAVRLADQQKTA